MKHLIISLVLAGGVIAFSNFEASAVARVGYTGQAASAPAVLRSFTVLMLVVLLSGRGGGFMSAAGCTEVTAMHQL